MKQKATVLEIRGKNALVSVRRSSMCEGCEKNGGCSGSCSAGELFGANRTMTALASNKIGAKVGDTVEIETESRIVLAYAALIFLLPILLAAAVYGVIRGVGGTEIQSLLGAFFGAIAAFLLAFVFDRTKKRNEKTDIIITRIC